MHGHAYSVVLHVPFYNTVGINSRRTDKLEKIRSGCGLTDAVVWHTPGGTDENYNTGQDSRYPSRDFNWAPHEYECRALLLYQLA
jgi:hypothetical protein